MKLVKDLLKKIGYRTVRRSPAAPHVHTWPLVAFGFGAMTLLGVATTMMTIQSITHMRQSVLALTDANQNRREQIEGLRSQIYVSSVLIRDYLLDRQPTAEARYRERLQENHAAAMKEIEELSRFSPPSSDATLRSLAVEIDGYWRSLEMLLEDSTANRKLSPNEHIRKHVIPRRQTVIALAEELADAGAAEAKSSRQALNTSLEDFSHSTVLLRTIAAILATGLAVFTTFRVFHLERAASVEHARVERAEEEMRNLSQKMVISQEQERRSLSRELHDHVGQMVTSLRFGLADLERQCPAPTQEFSETLGHCRLMLEETIEAVRGIAMGLRPTMLDDLGLAAAIEWQAREFSRRFNIPVTVTVDKELSNWPEPQRTALYRIMQEALTNCARHAKATSIRISLAQSSDLVSLSITDNGVGLPPGPRPHGFGLLGIEERVREMGGRLNLRSTAIGGTMLEVQVPLMGATVSA